MWRPRRGSHTSQTGKLTSAAIDARDFQRARKDRKTMAHLPQGTLVSDYLAARTSRTRQRSSSASTRPAPNTPTSSSCMPSTPASRRSRQAAPSARTVHQTMVQAGLGPPRSRRTVPPQRRPPEPAGEGRHRRTRQRHYRERSSTRPAPSYADSGHAHRGMSRTRARGRSRRWRGQVGLSRFNRRVTMLPSGRSSASRTGARHGRQPQQRSAATTTLR